MIEKITKYRVGDHEFTSREEAEKWIERDTNELQDLKFKKALLDLYNGQNNLPDIKIAGMSIYSPEFLDFYENSLGPYIDRFVENIIAHSISNVLINEFLDGVSQEIKRRINVCVRDINYDIEKLEKTLTESKEPHQLLCMLETMIEKHPHINSSTSEPPKFPRPYYITEGKYRRR